MLKMAKAVMMLTVGCAALVAQESSIDWQVTKDGKIRNPQNGEIKGESSFYNQKKNDRQNVNVLPGDKVEIKSGRVVSPKNELEWKWGGNKFSNTLKIDPVDKNGYKTTLGVGYKIIENGTGGTGGNTKKLEAQGTVSVFGAHVLKLFKKDPGKGEAASINFIDDGTENFSFNFPGTGALDVDGFIHAIQVAAANHNGDSTNMGTYAAYFQYAYLDDTIVCHPTSKSARVTDCNDSGLAQVTGEDLTSVNFRFFEREDGRDSNGDPIYVPDNAKYQEYKSSTNVKSCGKRRNLWTASGRVNFRSIEKNCHYKICMPNWADVATATADNQNVWKRYKDALQGHEEGHKIIYLYYLDKVKTLINDANNQYLTAGNTDLYKVTMCDGTSAETKDKANKARDEILNDIKKTFEREVKMIEREHNRTQDRYDSVTNHGTNQERLATCAEREMFESIANKVNLRFSLMNTTINH